MTRAEDAALEITERAVLRKFDGDLTPEQMETSVPAEVIVAVDGKVVDHWRKGDDREPPE